LSSQKRVDVRAPAKSLTEALGAEKLARADAVSIFMTQSGDEWTWWWEARVS
jgi:hypothetical protein